MLVWEDVGGRIWWGDVSGKMLMGRSWRKDVGGKILEGRCWREDVGGRCWWENMLMGRCSWEDEKSFFGVAQIAHIILVGCYGADCMFTMQYN